MSETTPRKTFLRRIADLEKEIKRLEDWIVDVDKKENEAITGCTKQFEESLNKIRTRVSNIETKIITIEDMLRISE